LAAGVLLVTYLMLFGSDAGLSLHVVAAAAFGGPAILVLWALRVALHLVATRRAPERRRVRRLVAEPCVLLICFAFVFSGAAFWLRFALSWPSLNRYAQTIPTTVEAGSFTRGGQVGLFWLKEVEVLPQGVVRMITAECHILDDCGLVYSPTGAPPVIGEDTYESMVGAWYHWWRSW